MVKFPKDAPATPMAETTTSPSTSPAPSSSMSTFNSRPKRPFKPDHYSMPYTDPFSGINLIHVHNIQNPPIHYFIHHHHCPFPPPRCAEMCTAKNSDRSAPNQPAKFYFGPGFEPQKGCYEPRHGRKREEYVVNFHVNPGVNVNLMMRDGSVEILRGGSSRRPVAISSAMVASQGVETSSSTSTTQAPHLHGNQHHIHQHHSGEVQYCSPVHSPYGEYYPSEPYHYLHIHQGEYGPVTVPMVSTNQSPPIAMPVHVPQGHMVQQIVDENGTLRHVILSPSQHPNLLPLPNPPHYNNTGPGNGTTQSQPFYPSGVPGYPPQAYHGMQGPHPVPSPTHLGHSPPPPNPTYYKDERTQRQHIKLKKKLQEKNLKNPEMSPRKDLVNGLKRGPTKGMSSVGTSEDGEESSVPDEEDSVQVVTDLLSSVDAPKVVELTSRSALLQWGPPLRLSESASNDSGTNEIDIAESDLRYEVLLSDKRDSQREMKFKSIYNGAAHSCRIQDLKPGQEYSVSLQVHLEELQGYATEPIKFVTPSCEPDQPMPPKLGNKSKNSLQLKWSAVNDNGARILYYILEYDAGKNGDFEEVHKSRSKPQFNLTKLQPATSYRFRLAVVNEVGKSLYSDVVSYRTTDNPPTQPDPPVLVEATVSTLHLKWTDRPKDEEYSLQMNDLKTKYGHLNVYNGRETSYVCQRLSCYSDYTFRLKAINEDGTSPWSEEVTFKTKPDRPDRPSKPVVKGRIHAYSFKLKWEPPGNTGGAEITRYILELNSGSGYEQVYAGSDTEAVCDRLTPGTTYQLRVSCASTGGQSVPSDPCTVTTEAIGPGSCSMPKLVGKPKPDSLTVRWTEPDYNGGAPVLDYELEMTKPDASRQIVHKSKETECTVSEGIFPGQEYVFAVRAVNRICAGSWSEALKVVSGAAPPGAPEPASLTCRSPFVIGVEWREPICNGTPVLEYRLEISSESPEDPSQFTIIYQGSQTSFEAKNLSPFKTYFFRVQASSLAGAGPYSPVSATTTPAAPPTAVVISKSESTPTSIELWWAEPASNGSEILHYNIEVGDKLIQTEGPVLTYKIESLMPDSHYKVKVQAVNAVGVGSFSWTWRTVTLRLPPQPPSLECVGAGHNYLKLKWGEGKNMDYTQFSVEMESLRSRDWQNVYRGTAYTCKVNKLHEMTPYRFRINASNDAGTGDYSQEYEFSTTIAPPAVLKIARVVEVDQRTSTIEWVPSKNAFIDPIVYQVQLARLKEQTFRQVHRGSDTKCTLDNLEPGVEYSMRVCPVRVTPTAELPGPYSPILNFTTMTGDVSAVTKLSPPTPTHAQKNRSLMPKMSLKKLYNENIVHIWVLLFTILGIVISLCIVNFL